MLLYPAVLERKKRLLSALHHPSATLGHAFKKTNTQLNARLSQTPNTPKTKGEGPDPTTAPPAPAARPLSSPHRRHALPARHSPPPARALLLTTPPPPAPVPPGPSRTGAAAIPRDRRSPVPLAGSAEGSRGRRASGPGPPRAGRAAQRRWRRQAWGAERGAHSGPLRLTGVKVTPPAGNLGLPQPLQSPKGKKS